MASLLSSSSFWRICSSVRRTVFPWRNETFECCARCIHRIIPDERYAIMRLGRCPQCGCTESVEVNLADIVGEDKPPPPTPWLHF
ncbi:MAG: hypothetical protein AMXMBFR82_48560 [Candidatus Hydrogenedentota bacterium]